MYTDTFYPQINGVAVSIATLANALAKKGHRVFIQAPRPKDSPDISWFHKNVTLHYVRAVDVRIYPDLRIGTGLPLSLQRIREFQPDIIHIHTPLSLGIEGTLVGKRLGVPLVYTFHTYFMDPDVMRVIGIQNRQVSKLVQAGGWRFNNAFCSLFDAIIAPSEYVSKDLKKHHVRRPIYVCPNMLDESVFDKGAQNKTAPRQLLYVGRLSPEKRVHLLLHALAKLAPEYPDLTLTIIGDGPAKKDLFDLSFELGVNAKIRWYGQVPHHELISARLYHLGDIFTFLSRFETQGLVTLEAMAHGLPVIATASRANREVIGTGGVVLSDTAHEDRTVQQAVRAIRSICQQDLRTLRQKAYAQAELYKAEVLLPRFLTTYQRVLETHQKES